MKIEFDTAEEYIGLVEMLDSSWRYWKKRYQEAQGKICMTLDSKGVPTSTHYTAEECLYEMAKIDAMREVVCNQTHVESEWSDDDDDWTEVVVEGVAATYVEPEEEEEEEIDEDAEKEIECLFGSAYEAEIEALPQYGPRPNCQGNFIDFINTPAYANGRWNLGYKEES